MDRRPALDRLDRHRTAHLQLQGGSLGASSEAAHSAPAELPVAAVRAACLAEAGRNRRVAVLENDRTAMGTSRAAQVIAWCRRGRCRRVRRASIANAGYRTPGLYSRNQPRTNTVLDGEGVNLPS